MSPEFDSPLVHQIFNGDITLGNRLMVGRLSLKQVILVRTQVPHPNFNECTCDVQRLACVTSNHDVSVRIRPGAPTLERLLNRDCPEIGADSVWSGEDAGASPVSLTKF